MKIKLQDNEWQEVGELVEVTAISLHKELPKGTTFVSSGGIKVFFSKEDMDKITEPSDTKLRF